MSSTNMSFSKALDNLKLGKTVTRANWYGTLASPRVKLQKPDEHSKMTEPYLYMEKRVGGELVRFPLDLSCESLMAEDWIIV